MSLFQLHFKESKLALKGRRPGDAGRRGASAVPAGAASSAAHSGGPGIKSAGITTGMRGARWKWMRCRRREARPVDAVIHEAWPGSRLGDEILSLAGTVVERRQARAPGSGRCARTRSSRGATAPAGAGLTTVRLPAFRFLISFVLFCRVV